MTDYYYDSALRVNKIETVDWDQDPVMYLVYLYDNAGNVKNIVDVVHSSRSQSFIYDKLHRLVSASGIYGNSTYEYNSIDNMTKKASVSFQYTDPDHVHAVTNDGIDIYDPKTGETNSESYYFTDAIGMGNDDKLSAMLNRVSFKRNISS